ncbi:uncharacterized protein LOC116342037 [Contarinia nasturtii]|uniref:uncharacterized protein LOC116342037 n=1 Tax=Contarinia nasturtii TaxID=265458 RepID=UPI0012D4B68B|nr:uncharacterized protein LOC116342037 [Contarinia nasturtii]XP_031625368.1 uncharacterized protein LOC116342037 [Contarinia nasturtii]
MTASTNQSELNKISNEIIRNSLVNFVKKHLKSDDVEICIECGSKKGDNFQGEIFRVLYKEANNNANENDSSLILKIAAKGGCKNKHDLFVHEINMYEKVLSYFNEFQLSKGVDPEINGFNEYPECYFSTQDNMSESVFLEDLRRRGFEMFNHRKESITFDHVSLFMKALGKFHAISFALKDQQTEKFKHFTSFIPEQFWVNVQHDIRDVFLSFMDRLTSVLEDEQRFDLLEKFKNATGEDSIAFLTGLLSMASKNPCAVITHGDATINNTMFSKDNHGKPNEIQIFDWQCSRFSSPVLDLVIYLFCSATKELRDQHYDEFLKIYHNSLSDLLKRLGSDPEKLFPYEELLNQLKQFGKYVVFVAVIFIQIMFADEDSIPNVSDEQSDKLTDDFFQISDESKPAYRKHVLDLFIDLDRLGYL